MWSVKCGVLSLECQECSVRCEVWSIEGRKDTVGIDCL